MTSNLANLALDGGDPREKHNPEQYVLDHGHGSISHGFSIEAAQVHNDPDVLFEEYIHFADITRAEEKEYERNRIKPKGQGIGGIIKSRFSKGHRHEINTDVGEHNIEIKHNNHTTVTDLEWKQASRALRTAGWSAIFFLITTDILGPTGAP